MSESTIQPDLVSLKSKLVTEIEKDQKEHELIGKRIEKNRELLQAVNASLGAMRTQGAGGSSITGTIRAVIATFDKDTFTAADVDRALTEQFPTVKITKEDVRGRLWTMQKRREFVCVERGIGNQKPAVYSMASSSTGGGTVSGDRPAIRRRGRPLGTAITANGENAT